jgi:hypothetical protein
MHEGRNLRPRRTGAIVSHRCGDAASKLLRYINLTRLPGPVGGIATS